MHKLKAIAAIAGITILMSLALYLGYDGVMLMGSIGIIAGLGGAPLVKQITDSYEIKGVEKFLKEK